MTESLPDMVETYRARVCTTFPDGVIADAHYRQSEGLYARILATPLAALEDGPAKISAIFMQYEGCDIDNTVRATIIRIAEDMVRLAGEVVS